MGFMGFKYTNKYFKSVRLECVNWSVRHFNLLFAKSCQICVTKGARAQEGGAGTIILAITIEQPAQGWQANL